MIRFETINEAGGRLAEMLGRENIPFEGEAIVFIGALGICVRRIQLLIHDKATDPAVVCVDTTGRYVIPVLSGHIGGANELARQIARVTGGEAVITTQSDLKGLWALDTLGRDFGWGVMKLSRTEMNHAIATFVDEQPTALVVEWDDRGTRHLAETCPPHVRLFTSYADYQAAVAAGESFALLLLVSPHYYDTRTEQKVIQYYPRVLRLGVGCQRGTSAEAAEKLLDKVRRLGYAPEAIGVVATITLKKDEPLVRELCQKLPWASAAIYTSEELARVAVPNPSVRVLAEVGCASVAEAAAAVQGTLVVEKQKGSLDGCHYTFAVATKTKGHIEIVGAGPGDPELVSVRGRRFLEQADLILYAGSLVPRALTACAKQGATVRSSAGMTLDEQFSLMKAHYDQGHLVVRLHTGDPCIYGAIDEQMALFDRHDMDYHITPGISSFLAAAAELRSQLTLPGRTQTIILTRGEGRTPVPERERLSELARHGATLCIFLSAGLAQQVQDELLAGGYEGTTPVAACYRLTWPDQRIYRGELKDLARIVSDNNLTLTTMIVVGEAIGNREGHSLLYDPQFSHLWRRGAKGAMDNG
ncbi:MAG: precorrin-4 C(11)-methyltransferase [Bacteroidaceae bacterium]|nr:precorrin-4 C(11)-methyltransferase [Bacteroidaceae bacterium]